MSNDDRNKTMRMIETCESEGVVHIDGCLLKSSRMGARSVHREDKNKIRNKKTPHVHQNGKELEKQLQGSCEPWVGQI